MTTRRTLVWLILFVITVPTVAATADAVQRAQHEDTIITIPDLRQGDRYVYDLHWSSEAQDVAASARGHLVVEVGEVGPYTLLDGTVVETLPVTLRTGTPPWLTMAGEHDERVTTEYLRVPDGMVVAERVQSQTVTYERYVTTGSDGLARVERASDRVREDHDAHRVGILGTSGGPGRSYVNANEVFHALLTVTGLANGQRIQQTATLDGQTVYNAAGYDWSSGGTAVYCRLPFSDVTYRQPESEGPAREYDGRHKSDIWVSEDMGLPRAEACEATFVDRQTNERVETVRLDLVLAEYQAGAEPVRFDTEHRLGLPQAEPLPTEPVRLPGLPMQGELDLVFPMEDALEVLLTMPEVKRFRDDGEVPFMVTGFSHTPATPSRRGTTYDPASTVPDPLGVVPSEGRPNNPKFDAVWRFDLQNADGERLDVMVDRAYDADGEVIDEERQATAQEPWDAKRSDYAEQLVPLDVLLDQHVSRTGSSVEDWLTHPQSRFSSWSSLSVHDRGADEMRNLRSSVQFYDGPESDQPQDGRTSRHHSYDLETGVQTSRSETISHSEQVERRSQRAAPPALQTAGVVPVSHVPAAATASGFAVALAFAAAYFWDGLVRAFAQVVVAPMYAKIRKDKVLDHKARDDIMTYVKENPGAALGSVRNHLGAGYGTTVHHLNTLEQNGLLVSRKVGRQRCYFPAGTMGPGDMDATAASRTAAAGRFLELVTSEPGLSQQEIAERLGVADASVRYQAKRLVAHRRLRVERDGRAVRYYPGTVDVAQ